MSFASGAGAQDVGRLALFGAVVVGVVAIIFGCWGYWRGMEDGQKLVTRITCDQPRH